MHYGPLGLGEALSRCRLKLLDLKTEGRPLQLQEALREAYNSARHAADELMEMSLVDSLRAAP